MRDRSELDALLAALNRSAERMQALWFTFIGLTLYFVLTALTTTHRMLLLEEPQNLPIVNLKVPLLPFYVIAPIFYLGLHFYVLLMLVLLSRSAKVFEVSLGDTLPIESERERYRMRLENAPFLQMLCGAREERTGFNSLVLALMAALTVAVAPVVTLVVMQWQFLPYHHWRITWLHRLLAGLDMVLVTLLWRGFRYRWGRALPRGPGAFWRGRRRFWQLRLPPAVMARAVPWLVVVWLSGCEGRWAGEPGLDPTDLGDVSRLHVLGISGLLLRGPPPRDPTLGDRVAAAIRDHGLRPLYWSGLFADRLALSREIIVGTSRLDEVKRERDSADDPRRLLPTRDFKGRDFTLADFSGSDLRGVDFAAVERFDGSPDVRTSLWRANLNAALLAEARFRKADMRDARMASARLDAADLTGADLSGGDLRSAVMDGVAAPFAKLHCTLLQRVSARGASFDSATMTGADLRGADLRGVLLTGAAMRLADLRRTDLTGARIADAFLEGSLLQGANGSAVDFVGNQTFGADLDEPLVGPESFLSKSLIERTRSKPVMQAWRWDGGGRVATDIALTETEVGRWLRDGEDPFPPPSCSIGSQSDLEENLLRLLRDPSSANEADAFWADVQSRSEASDPDGSRHREAQAKALGDLACQPDGAPYVARGLIAWRLPELDQRGRDLVKAQLKAGGQAAPACPAAAKLTPSDWLNLESPRPAFDGFD
jgi:uncharacterized protein YjbI with pentapeptide repeats